MKVTPTLLTDSSGGTASSTLAAGTNTTALTDNGAGTADGTVAAMADPADTPATADVLRDDLVANFCAAVRNNFKEVTTELAAQRTLNGVLLNHVASLAAKVNSLVAAAK